MLRIGPAARYVGVTTGTLRIWERQGRITPERIGWRRDRRFKLSDLNDLRGGRSKPENLPVSTTRREALYVRVGGRGDRTLSLAQQEETLRSTSRGEVVMVYKDIRSGLSESRRGLNRALASAAAGRYDVLRVTHRDRLAHFGTSWIEMALSAAGVTVEVLYNDDETELLSDFMSLLASFSGRMYGQHSADACRRLLAEAEAAL